MSDSLRQGDPGIAAGVPLAKGLWMLGASGAVAALTVAGVMVVSPEEPAVSPSSQVLTPFAPGWAQPPGLPSLDDVPLVPRSQPSTPDQAATPGVVSAGEVLPPAVIAELRVEDRGVVGERPRSLIAPQVKKVVALPVQQVQAVVETVQPAQVVPDVVRRVQVVVQPVRPQRFGQQFVQPAQRPRVAPRFATAGAQPVLPACGDIARGGCPSRGFDWFGGAC